MEDPVANTGLRWIAWITYMSASILAHSQRLSSLSQKQHDIAFVIFSRPLMMPMKPGKVNGGISCMSHPFRFIYWF